MLKARTKMRQKGTLCCLFVTCLSLAQHAQDLENIAQQIQSNQNHLKHHQKHYRKMSQQLAADDKKIAAVAQQLWSLEQEMKQQQAQQLSLTQAITKLQSKIAQQQKRLAKQLQQLALLNRKQPIFELVQHTKTTKLFAYYDYLNQARIHTLKEIIDIQKALESKQTRAEQISQQLNQQLQQKNQQKNKLAQIQHHRQQHLKKQKQQIEQYQRYLDDLYHAKDHLQQLTIAQTVTLNGLTHLSGKLYWPVHGKLLAKFGDKKHSKLNWKGMLIGAQVGTPVQAVADGIILFSNWLEHYGMVSIIDHGGGYLSLYGHNQTLLKKAGEAVKQAETIALSGHSGFQQQPALYFEMRHQGKVINPQPWLRKDS